MIGSSSSNGRTSSLRFITLCVEVEDCHVCCCSCCGFALLLAAGRIAKRCISALLLVLQPLCAIDFGLLSFAQFAPSFIQAGFADFVNAVLPASDFLLLVRGTSQRGKNHDVTKTPSQRIACSKRRVSERAKADERKQRTRRLIEWAQCWNHSANG
jgi:hypothetical protein